MSGSSQPKDGPALGGEIEEVQAVFESNAALEVAMGELRTSGFDHADLSLPAAQPSSSTATPDQGAKAPATEDDMRNMRALSGGTAAAAGAMLAAGVVVATGGAALAAAGAAAAAGVGAGGLVAAPGVAASRSQHEARAEAAVRGELVLSVRTITQERQLRAIDVMQKAGAKHIAAIRRTSGEISAASWTG